VLHWEAVLHPTDNIAESVVRHCSLYWDERKHFLQFVVMMAQGCSHLVTPAYLPNPLNPRLVHLKRFLLLNLCTTVTASVSITERVDDWIGILASMGDGKCNSSRETLKKQHWTSYCAFSVVI
jgi:hypothetical protein